MAKAVVPRKRRRFRLTASGIFSLPIGSWPARHGRTGLIRDGSNQSNGNVDIAAGHFGIRAGLVGFIDNRLGNGALHAWYADVQARLKKVRAFVQTEIDFCIDDEVIRESNLLLASSNPHRTFEAGRPARRKQLLRIGTKSGGPRG